MRKLATFDDPERAETVQRALAAEDIGAAVRAGADGSHTVWILAEDRLADAHQLLDAFTQNPDAARFQQAKRVARVSAAPPRPPPPPPRTARPRVVRSREAFGERASHAPLTLALVLASAAVSLLQLLGYGAEVTRQLSIASYGVLDGFVRWHGYEEILHGQVWRLFTPVLLHFGIFHLLFNVMWMLDLGAAIERFQGSREFAGFIVICAIASNLAQLELGGSPAFGGLSGLVYALVGYVWARGRFDPLAGIMVRPQLMTFLIFWLVLGFTGVLDSLVGRMANYCHLGGLISGAAYGYVAARRATRIKPR